MEPLLLHGFVPYPQEVADGYRAAGEWTDQTLPEMLFETVEHSPERIALIAGDVRRTYAELAERVLRLSAGLQGLGLTRGDRVVVHLPNLPEFIELVFALWEIGAVPVVAPAAHRRAEIEYFIDTTEARAYITVSSHEGTDLAGLADELLRTSPTLKHTIILAPGGGGEDFDALLGHDALEHARRSLPQDVALLQMSGGTTGRPKLIPHTHETYIHSVTKSVPICGITQDTVQIFAVPICHSMSMRSPGFLGLFQAGGTVVLAPNGSPDSCFPLIEKHGVTRSSLVPPIALAWLNSSLREQYDLSSLSILNVGGAKFSEEAARRMAPELHVILQQGVGMAEGLVNYNPLELDFETSIRYQGIPASEADELLILDDEGNAVPVNTPGHLLTRGPSTIRGYYKNPEQNELAFTPEGFYRTGDIVERNERGFLRVVGRAKDQINRGGEKVAPEEVENHILAHEGVHNASVIGIEDPALGERVKAYVIPREGVDPATLRLGPLRRFLRERGLAAYKIPDVVDVVAAFPQTAIGKISKRAQREQ